jgi:asparagine synthetase B (glutamine-hydrolysing)
VELAMRLPDRLKLAGSRRKLALLKAMEGIVAPEVLARRDKIGFVPPQERWLREVAPRWRELVRAPRAEDGGYLRRGTLAQTLEDATVTLRDRDSLEQIRVPAAELPELLSRRLEEPWRTPKLDE